MSKFEDKVWEALFEVAGPQVCRMIADWHHAAVVEAREETLEVLKVALAEPDLSYVGRAYFERRLAQFNASEGEK